MESDLHKLSIEGKLWLKLMKQLKKKGKGTRESGAFLLGKLESNMITEFYCYDELDPNCLTGEIEFDASGFNKLWEYCIKHKLKVLADVHTHPYDWTNQSYADQTNPMICVQGHLAFIIPNYAKKVTADLLGVGAFEYLGSFKWKKHSTKILKIN
jgi:proteasome lid subunit RPN8/RPN11